MIMVELNRTRAALGDDSDVDIVEEIYLSYFKYLPMIAIQRSQIPRSGRWKMSRSIIFSSGLEKRIREDPGPCPNR